MIVFHSLWLYALGLFCPQYEFHFHSKILLNEAGEWVENVRFLMTKVIVVLIAAMFLRLSEEELS